MSIPVAFSVKEYNIRNDGYILLDGEPLTRCFNFNEAEGWADVWAKDEHGKAYTIGDRLAHERRHGVVQLVMSTPEGRAYVERMFPAAQTTAERAVRELTDVYFRERRYTIDLDALTRAYLAAVAAEVSS